MTDFASDPSNEAAAQGTRWQGIAAALRAYESPSDLESPSELAAGTMWQPGAAITPSCSMAASNP